MDSKQKVPESLGKTKKRDDSKDKDGDVEMMDRPEPEAERDSMSPVRQVNGRPAPGTSLSPEASLSPPGTSPGTSPGASSGASPGTSLSSGTSPPQPATTFSPRTFLSPGTRLFELPSFFTCTHAITDSSGGWTYELPVRQEENGRKRKANEPALTRLPHANENTNWNANGNRGTREARPQRASPREIQQQRTHDYDPAEQVAAANAVGTSFSLDLLRKATQMLLSKQDAGAQGYDWSISQFQQEYYLRERQQQLPYEHDPVEQVAAANAVGTTFSSDLLQQARQMLRSKEYAEAQGFESSPPDLGTEIDALINGLPSSAALSTGGDENQPVSSIESGPPQPGFITQFPSPPPGSLSGYIKDKRSARSPSPPLGSRLTPVNRLSSPAPILGGSDENQLIPSIESGSQHVVNGSGSMAANRPTLSARRREERSDSVTGQMVKRSTPVPAKRSGRPSDPSEPSGSSERIQERSDNKHTIYECCCPYCSGFAGESYTKFKRHLAEHFEKDGWTEYRCPGKRCDEGFAKTQLTQYMKYLEDQGWIQPKDRGIRDSLGYMYCQFKGHIGMQEVARRREDRLERETIESTYEEEDGATEEEKKERVTIKLRGMRSTSEEAKKQVEEAAYDEDGTDGDDKGVNDEDEDEDDDDGEDAEVPDDFNYHSDVDSSDLSGG